MIRNIRTVFVLMVLMLAACAPSTAQPPKPAAPQTAPGQAVADQAGPAPIAATAIIDEYEMDRTAADAKYKDQTLLISGKVSSIDDVFGVVALLLRESDDEVGLQCYLSDNLDAEKAQVGRDIVIRGTLQGGKLDFFMVAEGCVVVSS